MKTLLFILCCFTLSASLTAQEAVGISELAYLDGSSWKGTLMYINYQDGKEVNLRTTMQIEIKGNKIIMSRQFTDEPSANSRSVVKLKKDGTYFGEERIIKRTKFKDGTLEIETKFTGMDNNEPATIFKIYRLGNQSFSVTQRVLLDGSEDQFVRNRTTYTKLQ